MNNLRCLRRTVLSLSILGAINWGAISLINMDFVSYVLGTNTTLSRFVFFLIGCSGIFVGLRRVLLENTGGKRLQLMLLKEEIKKEIEMICFFFVETRFIKITY